jgi:predicted MFS family arabinose efflux permease/PAS domain-containing protein
MYRGESEDEAITPRQGGTGPVALRIGSLLDDPGATPTIKPNVEFFFRQKHLRLQAPSYLPALERVLGRLRHPRLAALATSAWPAGLWSADGSRLIWANAVGAAIFDAVGANARHGSERTALATQIVRLAAALPAAGHERLERLYGFGARFNRPLTCVCSRIAVDGDGALLVAAAEPAGPALPIADRVRRLFADCDAPIAAFALDGTLIYANQAGQRQICGATGELALGAEKLAAVALEAGSSRGTFRVDGTEIEVTAIRLGKNAMRVLALTLTRHPQQWPVQADATLQRAARRESGAEPPRLGPSAASAFAVAALAQSAKQNLATIAPACSAEALLDRMPVGAMLYRDGTIIYANTRFLAWSGYDSHAAVEAAGGLKALIAAPGADAIGTTAQAQKLSIRTLHGHQIPVEGRSFTLPWDAAPAQALILIEDAGAVTHHATARVLDTPEVKDRDLTNQAVRAPVAAEIAKREVKNDVEQRRALEARPDVQAARGLRNRWWIVVASVIGLAFSQGSINLYCFGLFLKPIGDDLGLSRSVLSLGVLCSSVVCALATPVVGRLIDRFGNRAVMLPGIACYGASIAALAALRASPQEMIYVLFGLAGLFGAIQTPIVYAVLICKWFDRERGLAVGLAVSGVGLGVMLVPQLAGLAIGAYGWRTAYLILSAMILAGAFVPVALFVRDPPQGGYSPGAQSGDVRGLPGLTVTQALTRSWQFWSLSLAFFIGAVAIFGTITHVVPMLADRGFGLQAAATALSSVGVAMIAGRVGSGYLLDRFNGPSVAIGAFLVPMAGIVLLENGQAGFTPFLGVMLCGVGIGAQIGLQPFFASRYFGLKSIGVISGLMFALFLAGTGVGPFISGVSFDTWHSYFPALTGYAAALVIAAMLFVPLGPYPYAPQSTVGAAPQQLKI